MDDADSRLTLTLTLIPTQRRRRSLQLTYCPKLLLSFSLVRGLGRRETQAD